MKLTMNAYRMLQRERLRWMRPRVAFTTFPDGRGRPMHRRNLIVSQTSRLALLAACPRYCSALLVKQDSGSVVVVTPFVETGFDSKKGG
jgi:hypothetical protein